MPIGRIGGNSVPDLNQLDSNPQSVASATGQESKAGGIGHRAVKLIGEGLSKLSAGFRQVGDSFAKTIENHFAGSAKDNLKSLFNRSPRQIETPIELKSFKSNIDDTYAQIGGARSTNFENSVYADAEPTYASLSDISTNQPSKAFISDEYVEASALEDEYIDAFPAALYASLSEITAGGDYVNLSVASKGADYVNLSDASKGADYVNLSAAKRGDSEYSELSSVATGALAGFKADASHPIDSNFYARVDSNSPPAVKEALQFVRHALDAHGASGGKALEQAGIFRNKKVIGQITPDLLNQFESRLKEVKAANAAKVASGFAVSASQLKYEKFNSDNASSPIHQVLERAAFQGSPKLADKVRWEFDQILARGSSGASAQDIALSAAAQVLGEKLKSAYSAELSDSPINQAIASSALKNSSSEKLENIKASYDDALSDAALNFASEGGLDKPFNVDAFKDSALAAAKATIEKYSF